MCKERISATNNRGSPVLLCGAASAANNPGNRGDPSRRAHRAGVKERAAMGHRSFATAIAIRTPASMNLRCALLLGTALLLPAAIPAAAETIDIAIGHQSMCTDTYTGGIV